MTETLLELPSSIPVSTPEAQGEVPTYEEFVTSSERALGHVAVAASLHNTHLAITEQEKPSGDTVAYEVRHAREYLGALEPRERKKVAGRIFNERTMSPFLIDALGGSGLSPEQLLGRLNEVDGQGNHKVADETVVNFLEWHNHALAEKQQVFEREVIAPLREKYITRFQEAIAKGWLPEGTLDDERLKRILETPHITGRWGGAR